MRKFSGLSFTTFILGIIVPIIVVIFILDSIFDVKPSTITPTSPTVELECSYVDLFCVNFDMYGKYTIGSDMLIVDITNDMSNMFNCDVWIEDMDGNRLTDVETLSPSEKRLTTKINTTYNIPGKYDCKLVYSVDVINDKSRIECPYVILVNGGE